MPTGWWAFGRRLFMDARTKKELSIIAVKIRMAVIEGTYHAKSGHPGGSLSIVDDLTYLYWKELRIDPADPQKADRDRLVLSKGHAAPALYGALAHRGYFSTDLIPTLRKVESILQGHPDMKQIPGVDMSTGSLGQGISCAVGMALSAKLDNADWRVYTILGDGEIEEGQVWEAAMFAGAKKLDNLVLIVDNNDLQIDGTLEEVNAPYPIPEKFAAFGFHTIEIDAHDFDQIEAALDEARTVKGKPTVIIQKSIKGKGVSFMENQCGWHGTAPNQEQYTTAMAELTARLKELEG
jgi:transketolase